MKVLIIGSHGMLGNTLTKYLTLQGFTVYESNTGDDHMRWKNEVDIVVNCAGAIPQRHTHYKKFIESNTLLPLNLVEHYDVPLIHITTDCVYDDNVLAHDEDSELTATDIYGVSKMLGESPSACIIRTSIIGESNYGKGLLDWVRTTENKCINGFLNHSWNGVTTLQLSKFIHQTLVSRRLWKGVRHYYSTPVTKYSLVKYISEVYDINNTVIPHYTDQSVHRILTSKYHTMCPIHIKQQLDELKSFFLLTHLS
jgi:dTDP-4-dehydrorhamnose reductase